MGCATNVVRGLFFVFNFIFWVLGIVVLAIGIYSRIETDTWKDLIDSNTIFETANLLIAAGVIVAVIGFLGCCGAVKKWQWMLIVYSIIVLVIFALEIVAGAYAYAKRGMIQDKLTQGIDTAVKTNYGQAGTASEGMTTAIDWFQENVKCCGSTGPAKWKESKWYTSMGANKTADVPKSCCKSQTSGCNVNVDFGLTNSTSKIFTVGCIEEGKQFAKDNMWLIGGVGIGIAVIEIMGIGFALCLCCAFKKEGSEVV